MGPEFYFERSEFEPARVTCRIKHEVCLQDGQQKKDRKKGFDRKNSFKYLTNMQHPNKGSLALRFMKFTIFVEASMLIITLNSVFLLDGQE